MTFLTHVFSPLRSSISHIACSSNIAFQEHIHPNEFMNTTFPKNSQGEKKSAVLVNFIPDSS